MKLFNLFLDVIAEPYGQPYQEYPPKTALETLFPIIMALLVVIVAVVVVVVLARRRRKAIKAAKAEEARLEEKQKEKP